MNSSPLLSIVIPCYNHSEFIKDTITSVINQNYQNWECIIVDDGSTDNSGDIVSNFVTSDNRIKYIYQTNQGVSVARNTGISNAKGVYILPLDSDDIIANSYIEKAIEVFQNNGDVKLVYCMANLFGEINSPWNLPPYNYKELLVGNMIFSASVFKKEDYNATTGYDVTMKNGLEDWEFWIRFLEPKDNVYMIKEPLFFYRIKNLSRNNSINNQAQINLRRQLFKNNFDKYCTSIGEPLDVYAQNKRVEFLEKKLNTGIVYKLLFFVRWPGKQLKAFTKQSL